MPMSRPYDPPAPSTVSKKLRIFFIFNVNFLPEAVAIRNLMASLLKLRQNQDVDKKSMAL